jgi:hypothetical protein
MALGLAAVHVPEPATTRTNGHSRRNGVVHAPAPVYSVAPPVVSISDKHRRRVLVLGIYVADQPNSIDHVVRVLSESHRFAVDQRWVALRDGPPTARVAQVTVMQIDKTTPKYQILNQLLDAIPDLAAYDYVLNVDDANSWIDHPIVQQQSGVAARQTLFVEIGPFVSFHRSVYEHVFPFDLTSSMGWGFEFLWARLVQEQGLKMGIIDALPVEHSMRPPVAGYSWDTANAERDALLAKHAHLPYAESVRVVDVINFAEAGR